MVEPHYALSSIIRSFNLIWLHETTIYSTHNNIIYYYYYTVGTSYSNMICMSNPCVINKYVYPRIKTPTSITHTYHPSYMYIVLRSYLRLALCLALKLPSRLKLQPPIDQLDY